jgi:hypothetical protein
MDTWNTWVTPALKELAYIKTESGENAILSIFVSSAVKCEDLDAVADDTEGQSSEKITSRDLASRTTSRAREATTARNRPLGDQQQRLPLMSKAPSKFIVPGITFKII